MQSQNQERKWRAEDLGPRQFKAFDKMLRTLRSERNSHTRLTGVVGVKEDSYGVFTFGGGPVNEAAIEAWDALGEQFGWVVSRKTLKAVRAAAEAAIEKARAGRPVVDERRTPEEDAEIRREQEERNAEERERTARREANHDAIRAKAPAGAVALILAQYDEDKCDLMTDYFAHATTRTVAIGWRFSKREDFRRLREVAATFPETAHLGPDAPEDIEHRENWSMGSGNYLKDGHNHSTGWRVRSTPFTGRALPYAVIEDRLPPAPAKAEPAETREAGGATVSDSESAERSPAAGVDGIVSQSEKNPANVEVRFEEKPSAEVRAELKAARFRWSPRFRCWYGRRENLPARYATEEVTA